MLSRMPSGAIFCDLGGPLEPSGAILKVILSYLEFDAIWNHLLRSGRPSATIWRHLKGHPTLC
eukprot:2462326-Pyramimonas_sp.AAC.3